MTKIVIVLDSDGKYEFCLTDTEISLQILKKGEDDNRIDEAESILELSDEN
jgi:hypothetical protein